jgi:PPM family protein phosphatase
MILQASAATDVGMRRRVNEDRYALVPDLGLYLVADGMGGHKAGQLASQLAAEEAVCALQSLEGESLSLAEKLSAVVAAANRRVFNMAKTHADYFGMGTTLVAMLASAGKIAVAHVGDSRAYLIRGGAIRPLTHDHSLVAELLRRSEITAEAALAHPHRHVLTRALGVRPNVEYDLLEMMPEDGDTVAMFSDGLTNHVSDDEIALAIRSSEDLEEACNGLVTFANDRGGDDNITVALVRCEKAGARVGA